MIHAMKMARWAVVDLDPIFHLEMANITGSGKRAMIVASRVWKLFDASVPCSKILQAPLRTESWRTMRGWKGMMGSPIYNKS
jgi:hypothetical protein